MHPLQLKTLIVIILCITIPVSWAKDNSSKKLTEYESVLAALKKEDIVTALMILLPLAESGDKQSQFKLAKIYQEHGDFSNAIYWYKNSAEQGHMESQVTLGRLYIDGKSIDKNPKLAAEYLLMATRNRQAMNKSSISNTQKTASKKIKKSKTSDLNKGITAYNNNDYTSALMYWLPISYEGDSEANYRIGKMYLEQKGERKNPQKALYWFLRAAERNHLEAQTTVGSMYFDGILIEKDLQLASKWLFKSTQHEEQIAKKIKKKSNKKIKLEDSANYNKALLAYNKKDYETALLHLYPLGIKLHTDAQILLGDLYLHEKGIYKAPDKGLAWYKRAIDQGDNKATRRLALKYLNAQDLTKNTKKAINLLLKASRQGDPDSQLILGNIYLKGDIVEVNHSKAAYWFKQSTKKKNPDALFALAEMYMHGTGIEKNISKAIKYYKKADAKEHQVATLILGKHYYLNTKKADYKTAFSFFSKAAKQGETEAQYYLGEMYYKGQAVEKNYKKSFEWYMKAASLGHIEAEYKAGKMYVNGYGVKKNFSKGVKFFISAAKKGHPASQNETGVAYYSGQGANHNKITAYAWFYLASQNSIKDANKNRKAIYKSLSVKEKKKANSLVADFKNKYNQHQ